MGNLLGIFQKPSGNHRKPSGNPVPGPDGDLLFDSPENGITLEALAHEGLWHEICWDPKMKALVFQVENADDRNTNVTWDNSKAAYGGSNGRRAARPSTKDSPPPLSRSFELSR